MDQLPSNSEINSSEITENKIKDADWVILRSGNNLKVMQITDRNIFFERTKFKFTGVVGEPYGSCFEVVGGALKRYTDTNEAEISNDVVGDNRNLKDDDSNQKLTTNDIEVMKEKGVHGEEIIGKLIENSETFENKTTFSKEKYIKKKKKKFSKMITILKPTMRLLCQMHFKNRINFSGMNMRIDSLSQILSYSNVRSGANVITVESCNGLILGAVLERLGGYGKVVDFHQGFSQTKLIDGLPFTKEYLNEHVVSLSLSHIKTLLSGSTVPPPKPLDDEGEDEASDITEDLQNKETKSTNNEKNSKSNKRKKLTAEEKEVIMQQRKERAERFNAGLEYLRNNHADSLIVATKFDPTPIVTELLKFVKPSRTLVVYCQNKEPLMECYMKLKESKDVVCMRLTETWLREYQVLPKRTHPEINMSGGGGYILTGTTISNAG